MKSFENYAPWVDDASSMSTPKRKEIIEEVLSNFSSISPKAQDLVMSFNNPKEFEKLSLLAYLHFTPMNGSIKDQACHLKFPNPAVAKKHIRLPLLLAISEEIPSFVNSVDIDKARKSMGPDQLLSYSKSISKMNKDDKNTLVKLIFEGIKSYRKDSKKLDQWMSDYLMSNKDFELKGFALNLPYINIELSRGETRPFWVHAGGTPQLLYAHKSLPVIMIVGPSIRLDGNVLGDTNMIGYTF